MAHTPASFASSTASAPTTIDTAHADLRDAFDHGATRSLAARRAALRGLRDLLTTHQHDLACAVHADLRKPPREFYIMEHGVVMAEIDRALRRVKAWAAPSRGAVPWLWRLAGTRARVHPQPKGMVLIIGPWNFPLQLILLPLVGALAAGCTAILKPSELAPTTAELLAILIPRFLPQDMVRVVMGGVPETTHLLHLPFDHIFFTGSASVGRIVAAAAAQHLCPVTLELGGKSPVIIAPDTRDVRAAARRCASAKLINAGQVCLAPDYVLCPRHLVDEFVEAYRDMVYEMHGSDVQASPTYARIINPRQHVRLAGLLSATRGSVVMGGYVDPANLYIEPTLITLPASLVDDERMMSEEIFGPILPIVVLDDADHHEQGKGASSALEQAVALVQARPAPLALYLFAHASSSIRYVLEHTQSGGVTINDIMMHAALPKLPFGGVGPSGYGAYHGRHTFDTFSHRRAVARLPAGLEDTLTARYGMTKGGRSLKLLCRAVTGRWSSWQQEDECVDKPPDLGALATQHSSSTA